MRPVELLVAIVRNAPHVGPAAVDSFFRLGDRLNRAGDESDMYRLLLECRVPQLVGFERSGLASNRLAPVQPDEATALSMLGVGVDLLRQGNAEAAAATVGVAGFTNVYSAAVFRDANELVSLLPQRAKTFYPGAAERLGRMASMMALFGQYELAFQARLICRAPRSIGRAIDDSQAKHSPRCPASGAPTGMAGAALK